MTPKSPPQPAVSVEPDMSWVDVAICRGAAIIVDYSPGWAEWIDDLHFEDVFDSDPPMHLERGLYRWSGYKIGHWDEDEHIRLIGGIFHPRLSAAPPADGVPAGFVLVPIEPTREMKRAGGLAFNPDEDVTVITSFEAGQAYAAMLSTAPKAPTAPIGEAGVSDPGTDGLKSIGHDLAMAAGNLVVATDGLCCVTCLRYDAGIIDEYYATRIVVGVPICEKRLRIAARTLSSVI